MSSAADLERRRIESQQQAGNERFSVVGSVFHRIDDVLEVSRHAPRILARGTDGNTQGRVCRRIEVSCDHLEVNDVTVEGGVDSSKSRSHDSLLDRCGE